MQRLAAELTWLGSGTLSICLVINTSTNVWIENRLERAGLPPPGTYQTTAGTLDTETWGLDDYRRALQSVLRRRPNWSEGYVRLGLVHLGLYRQATQIWLEDSGVDLDDVALMSDPLWLLGTMHEHLEKSSASPEDQDVLSVEPVINHLVPAAHCFLEARRCSPFLALPHAELAALDYLRVQGDASTTYLKRALALSGNDTRLLASMAQIAAQTGDRELAAQCWRKSLQVDPSSWPEVADAAQDISFS